jgi:integrase
LNVRTAKEYLLRLNNFKQFVLNNYGSADIDDIIHNINNGDYNPYEILSKYLVYLFNCGNSVQTLRQRVVTAKNFLEYCDVEISPRKFKLKVKLPHVIRKSKEALSKEDIVDIINACSDIRLKTYVLFLAAGGFRSVEALSIRVKDLDLESKPARVFVRGEYMKTKTDRYVFLTSEAAQQLKT